MEALPMSIMVMVVMRRRRIKVKVVMMRRRLIILVQRLAVIVPVSKFMVMRTIFPAITIISMLAIVSMVPIVPMLVVVSRISFASSLTVFSVVVVVVGAAATVPAEVRVQVCFSNEMVVDLVRSAAFSGDILLGQDEESRWWW